MILGFDNTSYYENLSIFGNFSRLLGSVSHLNTLMAAQI